MSYLITYKDSAVANDPLRGVSVAKIFRLLPMEA